MQARKASAQQREARAGELGRGGEIHEAECLAQIGVVARRCNRLRFTPAPQLDVVVLVASVRHAGMRGVRHAREKLVELGLQGAELRLVLRELGLDAIHVGEDRRRILALGLGLADALGPGVTLRLELLGAHLQVLAALLETAIGVEVEDIAAAGQAVGNGLRIAAQQFGVEHRLGCSGKPLF